MAQQKIMFVGDVEGKFDYLFKKIETINRKTGPFDMLLCVGNFFGINNKEFEPYRLGFKKVPLPTYVLGPNVKEHMPLYPDEESEICTNIMYLGSKGLYNSTAGVKIAYISGIHRENAESDECTYTADDVVALRDICRKGNPNFRGVDILLTSQWPQGINNGDPSCKLDVKMNQSTVLTAWLCLQLKPRYHISGLEGVFYERPFRVPNVHEDANIEVATRFVGLGRVGNTNKAKWIYALGLTPLDKMEIKKLLERTTDETSCPFNLDDLDAKIFNKKRKLDNNQYFYDTNAPVEEKTGHKRHKREKVVFDQSTCWFCLSSPSVEKHLVVTVGTLVYLALAKGAIVDEHFLICPIEHHQSAISVSKDILAELEQFKQAIRRFYESIGKVAIFFERNFKTSHMQIQAVPIPKEAANQVEQVFQDHADGYGFQLTELESHTRLDQAIRVGVPYFAVELSNEKTYYVIVARGVNLPLEFGREVLGSRPILNLQDRIDWHQCTVGKEEEADMVKKIRVAFQPFDIAS